MGNAWTTKQMPSLSGKTVIVTGANSGTGYYTSLELAKHGATVVLACRNRERGESAIAEIRNISPNANIELRLLDLGSLKDVERFATEFNKEGRPLDILINNAGIMKPPYSKSVDGFESQLATNHLGHFALVGHLLPSLKLSSDPRVVVVSSLAAWRADKANVSSTDFIKDHATYNADAVYAETKMANLLFFEELAKRQPFITSVAAHPGISATNLWQHNDKQNLLKKFMQTSESGALPILRATIEPTIAVQSGKSYFAPRAAVSGYPVHGWLPSLAKDAQLCNAYWVASESATGKSY